MCKNLLIFLLAFCLSLISIQLLKQNDEIIQQPIISVSAVENDPQNESSKTLKPIIDFINNFQNAVERNDKSTVASFIKFPIKVRLTGNKKPFEKTIKTKDELLSNYDRIFDTSLKNLISEIKSEKFLINTGCETFFLQNGIRIKMFGVNDLGISKTKDLNLKIIKLEGKY